MLGVSGSKTFEWVGSSAHPKNKDNKPNIKISVRDKITTDITPFLDQVTEYIYIEINKNKKGNYIHFKLKGSGLTVSELEKNEKIDNNLLRFLTVRVKKFDLDKNYFKQETNFSKEIKEKNRKNDE